MKHGIKLISTLVAFSFPIAAKAACDRYPNATLTLNMPSTISIPDTIPIGGVIARQAFSGSSPAFIANCSGYTLRTITGRYPNTTHPGTLIYLTEAPGIGITVSMRWANGGPANFGLHSAQTYKSPGSYPSFTSAEATFYKIGPVTSSTVNSGSLWNDHWQGSTNSFSLMIGNSIRFIRAPATCDLAAGDVNRTITLPTIQANALKDVVYAGVQNFDLTANCSSATNVTFRFTGTPAPGNNLLFANTGSAEGVALWLYSRIGGSSQTISNNGTRTVSVSGNRAVLPLSAAYHRNGTVSAGTLVSTAAVNITYN